MTSRLARSPTPVHHKVNAVRGNVLFDRGPAVRDRHVLAMAIALILGRAVHAQSVDEPQANTSSHVLSTSLPEIVVTAQHRTQTTQDIPFNITALSGDQITNDGIAGVNGLTQAVAGLFTVDQGPATRGQTNNLTLRGLRTDDPTVSNQPVSTVATVSTYFGETPIFFPILLKDIERVEVLRGPQGTLYGSGAVGGTIRFVPTPPDFTKVSGYINLGGSFTDHSGQPNGSFDGAVNLPLADHLALRVVAAEEHLGGFINDVNLIVLNQGIPVPRVPGDITSGPEIQPVQKDTNSSDQSLVRAALRWAPIGRVNFEIDYVRQRTGTADEQFSNPTYPGGVVDFSSGT
jgi:iron complex outermembrane recepter protein